MSNSYQCSLGNLLKLERRPVKVKSDEQYREIGVYSFGRGIFHKAPKLGLEVGEKDLFLIREGDFILQITFAWEGAVGLASKAEDGLYGSIRFPTFRVDEKQCYPPYLINYFRTPQGRDQLVKISPGSAGRNRVLSLKRIPEIFVPLPSLEEQRRIVARIEELAARIEAARGLRREGMKKTELFFPSALESLFEGNDEDWRYEKLAGNGLATVIAGQHIMAEEYNLLGDGIPYLTGPADFGARVAEIKRWTLTPKSTSLPGDILLTVKGAGVGKINFTPDVEVAIGRQLMAIRPNPSRLSHEFIYFFLEHKLEHFRSIATATTVPGFKKIDVEELCIPVPVLTEQHYIVSYLSHLQSKVDSLRQLQSETSAELDALLPSILDKAFKGEL